MKGRKGKERKGGEVGEDEGSKKPHIPDDPRC